MFPRVCTLRFGAGTTRAYRNEFSTYAMCLRTGLANLLRPSPPMPHVPNASRPECACLQCAFRFHTRGAGCNSASGLVACCRVRRFGTLSQVYKYQMPHTGGVDRASLGRPTIWRRYLVVVVVVFVVFALFSNYHFSQNRIYMHGVAINCKRVCVFFVSPSFG